MEGYAGGLRACNAQVCWTRCDGSDRVGLSARLIASYIVVTLAVVVLVEALEAVSPRFQVVSPSAVRGWRLPPGIGPRG